MAKNEALKEDKKYIALLIGGSLLISLTTITVGNLLAGDANPIIAGTGNAVEVLGWLWVAGTVGIGIMVQARMRQIYGTAEAVAVAK